MTLWTSNRHRKRGHNMSDFKELLKQKVELDKKIAEALVKEETTDNQDDDEQDG